MLLPQLITEIFNKKKNQHVHQDIESKYADIKNLRMKNLENMLFLKNSFKHQISNLYMALMLNS